MNCFIIIDDVYCTAAEGLPAILSMPLYLYSGAAVLVTVRIVKEIPLLNPNIIFIRGSFGTPEKIWLGRRRIFSLTTLITFLSYKCAKAHNIKLNINHASARVTLDFAELAELRDELTVEHGAVTADLVAVDSARVADADAAFHVALEGDLGFYIVFYS